MAGRLRRGRTIGFRQTMRNPEADRANFLARANDVADSGPARTDRSVSFGFVRGKSFVRFHSPAPTPGNAVNVNETVRPTVRRRAAPGTTTPGHRPTSDRLTAEPPPTPPPPAGSTVPQRSAAARVPPPGNPRRRT